MTVAVCRYVIILCMYLLCSVFFSPCIFSIKARPATSALTVIKVHRLVALLFVLIVICRVYYVVIYWCYVSIVTVVMDDLCIVCIYVVFVFCSVVLDYFHIRRSS
jgi:hypothetical protein